MSEDNYVEWLVKRKDPDYTIPVKILAIALYIFSVLTALRTVLSAVIMLVAEAATYFIFLSISMEYEYLFVEGGLSVDRITGRVRRRRMLDCDKEDVQTAAPIDSSVLRDYERQGVKIRDFPSGHRSAKVYAMMYQRGAGNYKVLSEPNKEVIGVMRGAYPRRVVV